MIDKDQSAEWNEGYNAFLDGMRDDDSPYEEGSREDIDWMEGWEQADWDDSQT